MGSTAGLQTVEPLHGESPEVLRWQFLRGLRASKLLSSEDVDLLEREAPDARIDDLQQMLLDQGLLTAYQLKRIRDGKPTGLVLGQYRILDELGSGGFGQVYRASHSVLDRVVALKLITREYSQSRLFRDVFRREVAAVTRLNHPNIAATFDANEIDGMLFLAMEYVEGTTLHAYVCDRDPPPIDRAREMMVQLALGLQHAHENGLVHRDIKPANVLVAEPARAPGAKDPGPVLVKMIDFGLARLSPKGDQPHGTLLADAGAIVGTPAFMAPEQARNFHEADARSDLYSLGCTFYFLLTGRHPFEGASSRLTLEMHASKAARPLRDLRPEIPPGLAALVNRLMAKDPADRFQTADGLCAALQLGARSAPHVQEEPVAGTAPAAALPTPVVALHRPTAPPAPESPPVVVALAEPSRWADPVPVADLRRHWLAWCALVETHAEGDPLDTPEVRYGELYRSLVGGLESGPGDSPSPTPAQRDRILTLVKPWLTLRTLSALDRSSAAELWHRCLEYDAYFAAADTPAPPRRWWQLFSLLTA
jgi:serine/threonine-protein kinase